MPLRKSLAILMALALSGCVSERHFAAHSLWPFGNPNAPAATSETAQRALGQNPGVTPLQPQAGNVWPGPVQPMPTISQVEKNSTLPLGQGYTPSLPSPYPPGQGPSQDDLNNITGGNLYSTQNGVQQVPPPVPGDQR